MIMISKEEAMALRSFFGDEVTIAMTNKQKRGGRKRYYAPEERRVVNFLDRLSQKREVRRK